MFSLVLFALYVQNVLGEPCPNQCSAHGRCLNPGRVCECFDGYSGGDCSLLLCPLGPAWADVAVGIDIAHQPAECSNMGICDRTTGLCTCQFGFGGSACERKECPNNCNDVGKCQSMNYYARTKDAGDGTVYKYTDIWDSDMMYGCNCDDGFYGPACSERDCPSGDDPLTGVGTATTTNPNQQNTIQTLTCKAGGGTFTLSFRGKTTVRIPYNAAAQDVQAALDGLSTIGAGNTKLVITATACSDGGSNWNVEFTQAFGSLPLFVPNGDNLFFNDALNIPSITSALQQPGTKEDEYCSNRGVCDAATGICTCSTNFDTSDGYNGPGTRGDCGYAVQNVAQCPGAIACSAHGQCSSNPKYTCACSAGWTGADCSLRSCPTSVAWFTLPSEENVAHISETVECANMGVCDRITGTCVCSTGFTGTACTRMICPGNPTECSGHGTCLDMLSLAQLADINGDNAFFTYGAVPNNPYTWDATMSKGCFCDEGYEGYDCSLGSCPTGDDPLTTFQADERQLIKCTSSTGLGSLVFTFRQQSGIQIGAQTTLEDVQSMLENIPTVGKVIVENLDSSNPDSLCTTTDSVGVLVTFLETHGDLPMLTASTIGIDSIAITEYYKGTKENDVCSGRGLCDHTTGVCTCFEGFSSSDSMGGSGTKADCGYVEPIISLVTA